MKTESYNPSALEVEFANVLKAMKSDFESRMDYSITEIRQSLQEDNPRVVFVMKDKDGDVHELVLRIIQRPDNI